MMRNITFNYRIVFRTPNLLTGKTTVSSPTAFLRPVLSNNRIGFGLRLAIKADKMIDHCVRLCNSVLDRRRGK